MVRFEIVRKDKGTRGRIGILRVCGKEVETPVFMPVGTLASVKSLGSDDLEYLGIKAILANTFHLYLRPGPQIIKNLGGIHRFMGFDGIVITDSGGFQIYSLKELRKIKNDGVEFKSPLDGSIHFFRPEDVIDIQISLGSDFLVALDECTSYPSSPSSARRSVEITLSWAERTASYAREKGIFQRVFPVIQGSTYKELRELCAKKLLSLGFYQYAIGGLSVGEPKEILYQVVDWVKDILPEDVPTYLMGVGKPEDLIECVARGIDMFDCVIPTRNARNGLLYTWNGRVIIKNSSNKTLDIPIDENCRCKTCQNYPRSYLWHLYHSKELSYYRLATIHNLYFFMDLMDKIKEAIKNDELDYLRKEMKGRWD